MTTKSDDIKFVLEGMLSGIDSKNKQNYASVEPLMEAAVESIKENDLDKFFFSLIYPINNVIEGLLAKEAPPEAEFLFANSRFIENHFKDLFVKFEGSACCADKSRTIMRRLAKSFQTGEEIVFDYTQEYTYHLPTKIFKTHIQIMNFYKALNDLYYGNHDLYLTEIANIHKL